MNKLLILSVLLFVLPSTSQSNEHKIYLHKIVEGKNNQFIEYGISGSWHTECNRDQPYGKLRSQSCTLRYSDGSKWRSGIHKASGPSPIISISYLHPYGEKPRPLLVLVKMGYLVANGTKAVLSIGDKKITKVFYNNEPYRAWKGDEALQIIKFFIKKNKVTYNYIANNGRQTGSVSLKGFSKAWKYAINFTSYKTTSQ